MEKYKIFQTTNQLAVEILRDDIPKTFKLIE